jgi:hypothetical protein
MASDFGSSTAKRQHMAEARSRNAMMLVLAYSVVVGLLLVAIPPGWAGLILCVGTAFGIVTWYRPVVGVATVLGLALLFEQFDFADFKPVTRQVPFFDNLSYIIGAKGVEASPLEIMIAAVVVIVFVRRLVVKGPAKVNPLVGPVVAFAAVLGMWFLYGLASGGQLTVALWELRGLAYLCILILLVPQTIESERDVRILLWVAIATVGIKAAQGVWNYAVVLQGSLSDVRSITSHEDALFFAWLLILLLCLIVYRGDKWQRVALWVMVPVLAFTFITTDRRAAFVALALGAMVFAALLSTDPAKRKLIARVGLPVLILTAFWVAVGWEASGILGKPASIIRSIGAPDSQEDKDSSYYRRAEEVNLIHAIESDPLIGLGFGRPFQAPGQGGIVDVGFSLENVIPHNEIVWIWAKTGTIGFSLFWVFIGGVIAFGGLTFRTAREPYTKAIAAFVTCAVPMQIIVSYVDLQLTYARNMVFLGVLIAILSRLPELEGGGSPERLT